MKKTILLLIIALFSIMSINAQPPNHVSASEFASIIKTEQGIILDVRTPGEYSRGHIEGSTLINVYEQSFMSKVNLLQKDKAIYVYCLTGSRSNAVVNYLSQSGYKKVYNLQRGIIEWQQLGYPLIQSNIVASSASKTYGQNEFSQLLSNNNLVLVDFHAPWCAPCKKLSPTIEKIKGDYAGKAKVHKIDIEANKSLQNAYNIQSIPGLIIFKNGKEVWRHTGLISYEDLSRKLKSFI